MPTKKRPLGVPFSVQPGITDVLLEDFQPGFSFAQFDPKTGKFRWLGQGRIVHQRPTDDPVLAAIERITAERAKASAQIVVQGTMAYAHTKDFSYAVERCIPVDFYSEAEDAQISEVVESFNNLFQALGFAVITHPDIAHSSVHRRSVVQTRPMTAETFEEKAR